MVCHSFFREGGVLCCEAIFPQLWIVVSKGCRQSLFILIFELIVCRLVWVLSAVTLGALYYFNYTDVGIVNAIKMLWKL